MKRRVLVVNKFYYSRGGDCVCAMNLEALLKQQGYDVAVYAMEYSDNMPTEYDKYFAREIGFGGGVSNKVRAALRLLGFGDIKDSFSKILKDFQPDIVHLHNIHSYISPVVAKIAKDFGCRVVWTLHDYKLICPSYACLREEKPCELCFDDKFNVLKHRCMKGSLSASVLAYLEAKKWNKDWVERYVDAFVCPSEFMARKMAQAGFDKRKLHVICNFIDPAKMSILKSMPATERLDYYMYVGRLSPEKGVQTLLKVASRLPYTLKVAGDGPLLKVLKAEYVSCTNVEFLGRKNAEEVSHLLTHAKFSVAPSECYENNPLSVIESLCAGTPVIGANIGGIPELIDGANGLTFKAGDEHVLSGSVCQSFDKEWDNERIKCDSIERFSPLKYMESIKKLYVPVEVQ